MKTLTKVLSLLTLSTSLWAGGNNKIQLASNVICTSVDDGWTVTMLWPAPNLKRFHEYTIAAAYDEATETWGYHLSKGPRSEKLSYWLLEIPDCQNSVTGITSGVTWQNTNSFKGVKWNKEGTMTMTLNRPKPIGMGEVLVKSSNDYATCEIKAPQCASRCKNAICKGEKENFDFE